MNNKNYRFNKGRECLKDALSQCSAIKNDVQAYEALGEEEYLQTLQAEHQVRLCSISWSGLPQETWNQETLIVCCVQSWDSLGPTGVAKAPFELQHLFFYYLCSPLMCEREAWDSLCPHNSHKVHNNWNIYKASGYEECLQAKQVEGTDSLPKVKLRKESWDHETLLVMMDMAR